MGAYLLLLKERGDEISFCIYGEERKNGVITVVL